LAILLLIGIANADTRKELAVPVYINTGFGAVMIRPKVKSLETIKSKNIVKQHYDFSCGSATVATLFNYYLDHPLTEREAIEGLFKYGNQQSIIRNKGFSLLDIKKFATAKGYKVYGYKTDVKGLVELGKPAIVAITIGKYRHFVIFRGVYKGRVFLADPALGNTIVPVSKFESMWVRHIALVIEPRGKADNALKVSKKDLILIDEKEMRNFLQTDQIQTFKSPQEF